MLGSVLRETPRLAVSLDEMTLSSAVARKAGNVELRCRDALCSSGWLPRSLD